MYTVLVAGILLIVCSDTYAKPQAAHVYETETSCFDQHPSVDRDFIENIKRTRKLPENPTDDFKCFIACVGKHLGLMNEDGELHFENLKQVTVDITAGDASHDNAHTMVKNCFDVDHDDHCEKAYQYVVCKIEELLPYSFAADFCPSCKE